MKNTMTGRALTRAQLQDLRSELERERARSAADDMRAHTLNEALGRMDEGSYGRCAICGEPIPFDRLSVLPETLYCVVCGRRS